YLSVPGLIEALKRSGADAVHPGYGFLAENAQFARAVMAEGATWVGPPPGAIEVMGDKISARAGAAAAGVAPVPGTDRPLSGPEEVIAFADAHGWPVAIKAAFGGGGRGMRVVEGPAAASDALAAAQREAEAAFGRPECYLEKYLKWPRHVEVQVFGDAHGNMVHLGTRDCSVQRRHQKLIEEAPAPQLPPEILAAMGEAAVRVARACGYENAGTVELIYQDGEFFFLEMNTRLQVEHPVTEMVTGLDLVGLQLHVAAGLALPFSQEDVRLVGHAIEARVNAEDVAEGDFLPAPGPILRLRLPSGPWARADAGYEAGDEVSSHYDNLVAKVIAWGPDRERARLRLLRALTEMEVEGVPTTIPAHLALLSHPDFISVAHSTTWLSERVDLPVASAGSVTARPTADARDIEVELSGRWFRVKVWLPPGLAEAAGEDQVPRRDEDGHTSRAVGGTGGQVTVPMQGTIVRILVKPGDVVEAGQAVGVLEAMKMENNIVSDFSGRVVEVRTVPGASVGTGDVVVVLEG
ncbi:MAG TPA: biotin carboxylase N-terminal domain-containing protein, partial [Acidimicrobiales bacterium]|nr:biotin carboxylase N-terminal domain-containing protein [Acidimicrobiales bacterium]